MNFVLVVRIAVCVSILPDCNLSGDVSIDINVINVEIAFSFMLDLPAWDRVEELALAADKETIMAIDPRDSVEDLVNSCLALSV